MSTYIDTALFVKIFVLEANSPETIRLLEEMVNLSPTRTFTSWRSRMPSASNDFAGRSPKPRKPLLSEHSWGMWTPVVLSALPTISPPCSSGRNSFPRNGLRRSAAAASISGTSPQPSKWVARLSCHTTPASAKLPKCPACTSSRHFPAESGEIFWLRAECQLCSENDSNKAFVRFCGRCGTP